MRVLVTGAGGFVGRHLVRSLLQESGVEVIGVHTRPGSGQPGEHALVCDLRDASLTTRVIQRHEPEHIYHLAAQSYVPQALSAPADTLTNNAVSQINVLEACRAAGIDPQILIVGSAEVYGPVPSERLPVTEEEHFRPSNPYAVSKVTQDMLGLQYHLSYGMRIIRVRPFNHFGPGQSDRFVVSNFARQIAEVEAGRADPVILVGNLDAQRDFLDVRDVVRAYQLVNQGQFAGEVFNVASGVPRPIRSILDSLIAISSAEISVRQDPARMRPSDVPVLVGSADKLKRATGWQPEYAIEQSLADTLDYWRARLRSDGDQ